MPDANLSIGSSALTAEIQAQPLRKIAAGLDDLEDQGVRYCHWKSNYHIDYAVTAWQDVDILLEVKRQVWKHL